MKVDLLLFTYRRAPIEALTAIMAMCRRTAQDSIRVDMRMYGNALIHTARNKAISGFLQGEAEYALMVDDDMVPQPDALLKLLGHKVPIVSALFTTRNEPVAYTAKAFNPIAETFHPIEDFRPGVVVSGQLAVGAAFLLIHRDAVQKVVDHYLSASDWMDDNRKLLDRLHVRLPSRHAEQERIAAARKANWEKEGILRLFDYPVHENQLQYGEDIAFCRKLIRCDVPIAIDTNIWVGHVGDYGYGPWDIEGPKANLLENIA